MDMQGFDKTIGDRFGIVVGDSTLVLIKAERGESVVRNDKLFSQVANQIRQRDGFSVIVSANPDDSVCNLEDEIRELLAMGLDISEIIYIGLSDGALIGAQQGWKNALISRMLLINGSLKNNWIKTKKGIEYFEGEEVRFLYGDDDPSYEHVYLLDLIDSDRCEVCLLPGVDHAFSGREEMLVHEILDFV